MSLFKRGNVWWSYVYRDGVRYQQSTGTQNRRKAEKIEAKFEQEVNDRRFNIVEADPNITFAEIAARFIASGSRRPHHLYHLKFLLPFFNDFPVLRITKALADEFRQKRRHGNSSIKDATVNRDLSTLRRILYWAADERLIPVNPLARLKMARERQTRRTILSIAEEVSLLGAAKDHLHLMIVIALDTGMRRGEITAQRWEDIDFFQNVLSVTRSKTPGGESRELPLSTRLQEYLRARREKEGLVIGFRGRPVHIVKRAWKTALKNAGIRHIRFHDLRHTFVTRLMEAGVLQEIRMALVGHSPGAAVHGIYTHIELPAKREAIRKLETWITQQRQQLKEINDAKSETRSESDPGSQAGTQTVEEENACRGGARAGRQTENRDRQPRGGVKSKTQAASKIRRGAEAL